MARRTRHSETLESGSDSFLDIVANIVGILIILIVIAGVRMSHAPLRTAQQPDPQAVPDSIVESTTVDNSQVADSSLDVPPAPLESEPPEPILASPYEYTEPITESNPLPASELIIPDFEIQFGATESFRVAVDQNMIGQLAELERRMTQLRQKLASGQKKLQAIRTEQQRIASQSDELNETESQLKLSDEMITEQQADVSQQLAELMRMRVNLNQQLVLVQREGQPAQSIQHAMVPISKQVAGREWHFEVRRDKVSSIPLDELLGQLKTKVERWADWVAKYNTHEGMVGPVEGFRLKYKVSREQQSLARELSGAAGTFRIGVDRWELIPSDNGYAETLAQATQPNSQFRSTLNRCSLNDTITLWVYPDSFEMYQELSKICHQMGYQVAARPLPTGKPIGGSPNGTKSVSQ